MIKPKYYISLLGLIACYAIYGCTRPSRIYIDIKKQAIISCDGMGLKEIMIESDSDAVNLEGTASEIYFNKKNDVARTSIYGHVIYDYVLKLKPNCDYTVTKYNEHDRGPIVITFKTNSNSQVTNASSLDCN